MGHLSFRVDDYPGTKPAEFLKHNLESFRDFQNVFFERCLEFTLGVIPRYVGLADLQGLRAFGEVIVAMHGVDHDENPDRLNEFFPNRLMTIDQVQASLGRELNRFNEMYGKRPYTYIPPHNAIDNTTLLALYNLGFRTLMVGPGVEHFWPMPVLETKCRFYELDLVFSGHEYPYMPGCFYDYGRSDELLDRGSVPLVVEALKTRDVCLAFHFPWEHNIGLDHLKRYLDALLKEIDASHTSCF